MRHANIKSNDLVILNQEVWGGNLGWGKWGYFYQNNPAGGAYPNLLNNSVARYRGDQSERDTQFIEYWQARGRDLKNVVKQYSPNSLVLFFGENVPDPNGLCPTVSDRVICPLDQITYMPIGTGDARSPVMYYLPNLQKFEADFARGNFNGTYPWVSFSTSEDNGFSTPLTWDSKITQKLGWRLKTQDASGVIVYPGPYEHNVSVDYYLLHAKALADGFLRGLDPDAPPPPAEPPAVSAGGGGLTPRDRTPPAPPTSVTASSTDRQNILNAQPPLTLVARQALILQLKQLLLELLQQLLTLLRLRVG